MLKIKRVKLILAGMIIGTSLIGASAGMIVKSLVEEKKMLESRVKDADNIINDLQTEGEKIKEEAFELNKEKELLIEEVDSLKKKYDSLMGDYKKEIAPVSFNSSDLLTSSGGTTNKFEKALKGTGLEGLGKAYIEAEKKYGVNGIFLIALTAEESGWGNSNRAKTQNNLSGFAVYSNKSRGATFSSKEESIIATARLLKNDYLITSGKYYNGTSASSVNIKYCPDDDFNWSKNITRIANSIVSKINSL